MPYTAEEILASRGVLTFKGMNNIGDPAKLPAGFCTDICNMDVADDESLSQRDGYTTILQNAGLANAWSNDTYTYATVGGVLCTLTISGDNVTVAAINGVPAMQPVVEFTQVNDVVAFSDGLVAGILDGTTATLFGTPVLNL